jgi:hypothetical protein
VVVVVVVVDDVVVDDVVGNDAVDMVVAVAIKIES